VPHPRCVRVGLFHSLNTRRTTNHAPLAHAGAPQPALSVLKFRNSNLRSPIPLRADRLLRPTLEAAERRLYLARHAARLPHGRRREVPGTPQHKHSPGGAVDLPLQFSSLEPKSGPSQLSNFDSPIALGRSFVFAGAPSSVCEGGAFPFTQHAAPHDSRVTPLAHAGTSASRTRDLPSSFPSRLPLSDFVHTMPLYVLPPRATVVPPSIQPRSGDCTQPGTQLACRMAGAAKCRVLPSTNTAPEGRLTYRFSSRAWSLNLGPLNSQTSTLQSPWGARSFLRVPHPRCVRVGLFLSLNTRRTTSHPPLAHANTPASRTRDLPSSFPSRLRLSNFVHTMPLCVLPPSVYFTRRVRIGPRSQPNSRRADDTHRRFGR